MPTTTNYIWDEDNLLAEADGNNVVQTVYTNEPEQFGNLVSSRIAGTPAYHHFDAIGSTRQLTNTSGTVTDSAIYDAWGNVVSRTGATGIVFLWVGVVGYYFDVETGQIYIRERIYGPLVGRWTTTDPLGFLAATNRYPYAAASPLNALDPSGLFCGCTVNPTNVTGMLPNGGSTDTTIAVQIEQVNFDAGDCGQFDWQIWWHVRDAAGAGGAYILQKLSVSLTLKDCAGKDIAASKSPLVTGAGKRVTSITYWEEWGIPAGRNDSAGRIGRKAKYDDEYTFPGVDCSRGQLKVKGEYTVIDGTPPIPPFKLRNPDTLAGGAPSSTVDPKVSPTPPITWRRHDITVDWNCCP
jgi:RHS repeat-associated protein